MSHFIGEIEALSRVYPASVKYSSYWVSDTKMSISQALRLPVHDLHEVLRDEPIMIARGGSPILVFDETTAVVNWRPDKWLPQLEDPVLGLFCTCSLYFATGNQGESVQSTFFTQDPPLDALILSWTKDTKKYDKYILKLSMAELDDGEGELVITRYDLTLEYTASSLERVFGSIVAESLEFTRLIDNL